MATQVKGIITREMIDCGEMGGDCCPVAKALQVGVCNLYAPVFVRSCGTGGDIELYGKMAVRDDEFRRVREWIADYDGKSYLRFREQVPPISFTLTFDGEFS